MSRLSKAVKLYILVNELEQKEICRQTGIGESAMTRFLQGGGLQGQNFGRLIMWLTENPTLEAKD